MFALGYANNVIYIFVFLLVSTSITSMWLTNRNLEFIRFKNVFCGETFAGIKNPVRLTLENTGKSSSYALNVTGPETSQTVKVISPLSESLVEVQWQPIHRGWQRLPRFQVESTFPFDLLRTWRGFSSPEMFLVYPQRKGSPQFPKSGKSSSNLDQQGLFRDHRPFYSGDSVKRIDWRASAKHQEILLKVFESDDSHSFAFTWEDTRHLPQFEDRISQLALWIDLCEKQKSTYSLDIGNISFPMNQGQNHYRNCMKFLAELQFEDLT